MNDNDYQANIAYEMGRMDALNEMRGSRFGNEMLRKELNEKWNHTYQDVMSMQREWQEKIDKEKIKRKKK